MSVDKNDVFDLNLYFKDIKKYTNLTIEEESELIRRVNSGCNESKNELVERNLKFVVSVAKKYIGYGLSFCDLISEGNMGLIEAAKRFDATKNVRFISYAVWWVKKYIREAITSNNRLQIKKDEYEKIVAEENESGGTRNKGSIVECFEDDVILKKSREEVVEKLMVALNKRERSILEMYFGLSGNSENSLDDIAKCYNISSERVRKILDKTIVKLKCKALCEYVDENPLK